MLYLISYDISETKVRTKIADYLSERGRRLQKSVFLAEISKHEIKTVLKQIENIAKLSKESECEDSITCIPLCGVCRDRMLCLGHDATAGEIY